MIRLIKRSVPFMDKELNLTFEVTFELNHEKIIDIITTKGYEEVGKMFFNSLSDSPVEREYALCSHKDTMRVFNITTQTLSRWRREEKIKFEKVGGKYFYHVPKGLER